MADTVSRDQIYNGHITHLMHSSVILNRYRLYVFTANPVILGLAGNIFFLKGFNADKLGDSTRLLILLGLCAVALTINVALHLLTSVYLSIIRHVEEDLARLVNPHAEVLLWQERFERRIRMRSDRPLVYHLTYYGTFWIFYLATSGLALAALITFLAGC